MKKILGKIVAVGAVVGAIIDTHFGLLQDMGVSGGTANWIKVGGLVLTTLLPSIIGKPKQTRRLLAEEDSAEAVRPPKDATTNH